MFINLNAAKNDPTIQDNLAMLEAFKNLGINNFQMQVAHLKPTAVIKNTKTDYVAKYKDNHGTYVFKIKKAASGKYKVISDGNLVMSGATKKRVAWDFECQINNNPIKCL